MTTQETKTRDERLDEIERELEVIGYGVKRVLLEREYRILSHWEQFERQCRREGIVEVW